MNEFPAVFVGHGSPTLPFDPCPTRDFMRSLGYTLGRPKAILCISAHWETRQPTVSGMAINETLHDFSGFPRELYEIQYPAPGDPGLAARVAELVGAEVDPTRGLDHGAWVPLLLMYPEASIPVIQLSLRQGATQREHFAMGRALAPLRQEGVLILGSGNATHNLYEITPYWGHVDALPPPWVTTFAEWLEEAVATGQSEAVMDYRRMPEGVHNHPTAEHFSPLLVAMGAGGEGAAAATLHAGFTYGVLSMLSFRFD